MSIIKEPGKFEGEARYVPFYWDRALDGCANEDDGSVYRFYITKEDEILFSELKDGQVLELGEDGNGFVHGTLIEPKGSNSLPTHSATKKEYLSTIMDRYFNSSDPITKDTIRKALDEAYDAGNYEGIRWA